MTKIKHIVLTGTPNAGKSHLFDAMQDIPLFTRCYPEVAREYMQERELSFADINEMSDVNFIRTHKELIVENVHRMELARIHTEYTSTLTLHDRWLADTCLFMDDKYGFIGSTGVVEPLRDQFDTWLDRYHLIIEDFKKDTLFVVLPFQFGKPTHGIHTTDMFEVMHDIWCDNVLVLPTYEELGSQDVQQYIDLIMKKVNEINGERDA